MNYQLSIKHTLLLLTLMATTVGAWAQEAKIGETGYTTLKEAVEAANGNVDATTITLCKDLTLTYNAVVVTTPIVLDMAGHTITSHEKEPIVIFNGGDLTITGNGTISGPTGSEGASYDGWSVICVNGADSYEGAKAELTYLNGTLTCGGVGSDGMYGVYVLNGGTATFGTAAAGSEAATGPTIKSWFAAIGENNTTAPAHITVNGGSYTALANPQPEGSASPAWWYYFCAPIYAAAAGSIEISGGEFEGYYAMSTPYDKVAQELTITGGDFTATNGDNKVFLVEERDGIVQEGTRDVTVSGGTFSAPVPESLCAKDFQPEADADGKYTVIEAIAVSDLTTATQWSEHAAKGKPLNITYTRASGMVSSATNTGTMYGTLCLPFTITAQPTGMTLYKATAVTATTLTITKVIPSAEAPIAAGTPLIFELSSAATSLTLTSKKATVSYSQSQAESTLTPTDGNLLRGTYTAKELTTDLATKYYLNGDKFHQAIKKLKVPAYRAYIETTTAGSAAPRSVLTLVHADDADATSLGEMEETEPTIVEVHDILGHPKPGLQRGINLVRYSDGRTMKVIVK